MTLGNRLYYFPLMMICSCLMLIWPAVVLCEDDHDEDHEDVISISAEQQAEFGILTDLAGPGIITTRRALPGEIHPNDDRLAHLVPRYEGIVTAVYAHEGDHVKRGQVLAVIESNESLAPYPLKTLIDGVVIAKHITLGESASPDRAPFVVADLSTVWIELSVYQRDLVHIRIGQSVHVTAGGEQSEDVGLISYVTPVVDEHTRTAKARIVLDNANGQWRPGMFVVGEVELSRREVTLAVPTTAVFTVHDRKVVFVAHDDGFEARAVQLGERDPDRIEILSGLTVGDIYVNSGGFTLKAELEKSAFGDGHGH